MSEPKRGTSLSPPEFQLLAEWCESVSAGFGDTPYLVGSVARGHVPWRDVDVRVLLDDDRYDALFAYGGEPMLRAMNLAVSLWGQKATGLPIDFQFQRRDDANAEFRPEDGHVRSAIGIASLSRIAHRESTQDRDRGNVTTPIEKVAEALHREKFGINPRHDLSPTRSEFTAARIAISTFLEQPELVDVIAGAACIRPGTHGHRSSVPGPCESCLWAAQGHIAALRALLVHDPPARR